MTKINNSIECSKKEEALSPLDKKNLEQYLYILKIHKTTNLFLTNSTPTEKKLASTLLTPETKEFISTTLKKT